MEFDVDGKPVFGFTNGREFDAGKPTLLFIHGAGMDHSVWTLQARYFAHHNCNAVAIDLPGHGRSMGQASSSIEEMADWTAKAIDGLGIDEAVLIGHSMGALVSLETAARYPGKVSQLVLLGIAAAMPVHQALLKAALDDDPLAVDLVTSWGHGPRGHLGGNQAPGGWLMGHAQKLLSKAPDGVLHQDLAACHAYNNGPAAAQKVRCPTLIISGDHDRMTPKREGAKLAAMIKGGRLSAIDGAGHLMMVEKPDATLDVMIEYLGELALP